MSAGPIEGMHEQTPFRLAVSRHRSRRPAFADANSKLHPEDAWPRAKAAGISRKLFERASPVSRARSRGPETRRQPARIHLDDIAISGKAVTPIRIETGKGKKRDRLLLDALEKRYGVDRNILLAIWGMERNFGRDKGPMGVMRSLATLAYSGTQQ